jgi:hypothetical protein
VASRDQDDLRGGPPSERVRAELGRLAEREAAVLQRAREAQLGNVVDAEDAVQDGALYVLGEPLQYDAAGRVVRREGGRQEALRGGLLGEWGYRSRRAGDYVVESAARRRSVDAGLQLPAPSSWRWTLERLPGRAMRGASRWEDRPGPLSGRVRVDEDPAAAVLDAAAASVILGRLTAVERVVVRLRAEQLTHAEIAAVLHRSVSWVEKVLRGARRRLSDLAGGVAGVVLGWWLRRTVRRRVPGALLPRVGAEPLAQLVAVVLLGTLGGVGADMAPRPGSPGAVAAAPSPPSARPGAAVPVGRAPGSPHGAGMARGAASRLTTAVGVTSPSSGSGVLGRVAPGQETPEDTQFATAAAAPGPTPGSAPIIVALGMGRSCACPVLFESSDGGASWTSSSVPAPPDAKQVVLPPAYPRDSRIFVGTDAVGGMATYVVAHFGAPPVPLPGPAGLLALAAGFDAGDDRLFVAGQDAVVAIAVDDALPRLEPVLIYPASAVPASVATPGDGGRAAVLVLAPTGTAAVGQPLAAPTSTPTLFRCPAAGGCTPQSELSQPASVLSTAPGSAAMLVRGGGGMAVATTAGASFQRLALPTGTLRLVAAALGDDRVRAVVAAPSGHPALLWAPLTGPWHDVTAADPRLQQSAWPLPLPGGRLLDLLAGGGLLCSADGGFSWSPRCP